MSYILKNIDPTTFNVLSDGMAEIFAGVLLTALGVLYPHLLWRSIQQGRAVSLRSLQAPPESLYQAYLRLKEGGVWWLWYGITGVLVVATFAHLAADSFLQFESVQVSTQDIQVLSLDAYDVPSSYALMGDQQFLTMQDPPGPVWTLQKTADSIALGLSRFSILPQGGEPELKEYNLVAATTNGCCYNGTDPRVRELDITSARPMPSKMGVRCKPTERVKETIAIPLPLDGPGYEPIHWPIERWIPNCDYEQDISADQVGPTYEPVAVTSKGSWSVVSWTSFSYYKFRIGFQYPIQFWENETFSPFLRSVDNSFYDEPSNEWRLGRATRTGLTLHFGETNNDIKIQVEYSVLSWPRSTHSIGGEVLGDYTLSSWSKRCPVVDKPNNNDSSTWTVQVADYSILREGDELTAGCIIDTKMTCEVFPDDFGIGQQFNRSVQGGRSCGIDSVEIILLEGIHVDPVLLAVYSGVHSHNMGGIQSEGMKKMIAVNSLASAYVITRKIVPGSLAVYDVRPSIGWGYVFFMSLPLVLALPALFFLKTGKTTEDLLPNSIWKAMIFGRFSADHVVNNSSGSTKADEWYPEEPPFKFGIIHSDKEVGDYFYLGLGTRFVPKTPSAIIKHECSPSVNSCKQPTNIFPDLENPIKEVISAGEPQPADEENKEINVNKINNNDATNKPNNVDELHKDEKNPIETTVNGKVEEEADIIIDENNDFVSGDGGDRNTISTGEHNRLTKINDEASVTVEIMNPPGADGHDLDDDVEGTSEHD